MASEMQLHLVASLLQRGASLDHLSSVLTLLGLLAGIAPVLGLPVAPAVWVLAVVMLILGIAEKYWAQRVAIDAQLFPLLATKEDHFHDAAGQLDTALQELGLAPKTATPRTPIDRSRGALRLLRRQVVCLGAQCFLMVAACIAAPWF